MSYNYGAKLKRKKNASNFKKYLVLVFGCSILGGRTLLFFIDSNVLLSLVNASSGMKEIETGLRILSLSFIVSSFGVLMSGVLKSRFGKIFFNSFFT